MSLGSRGKIRVRVINLRLISTQMDIIAQIIELEREIKNLFLGIK